ncbi:MAG: hypothetical protein U1E69_20260 [Tabrizicola sp.]|uniref:hypothetical protein n=1 Tax=Tabrizicola sp. TaxID=2005166 RepID=UPI002AB904DC|nr:hypothetical protein [Tabrizicola sp.]MDZ4089132.1 hypothetical protein [Tabrizicola sp.]
MRSDKLKRHERLCELVAKDLKQHPQEYEGYAWAIRSQSEWCGLLDVSDRTLRDLIKEPPIRTMTTHVEGRKAVLLRLGEPDTRTDRHLANIMANIFEDKAGRRPKPRDYGILRGLAQHWPEGAQLDIFRFLLKDWPLFRVGVSLEVDRMIHEGEGGYHWKLDYPVISVMLRFHRVALEAYVMHLQENGLTPPDAIVALNPALWWHLTPKAKALMKPMQH